MCEGPKHNPGQTASCDCSSQSCLAPGLLPLFSVIPYFLFTFDALHASGAYVLFVVYIVVE